MEPNNFEKHIREQFEEREIRPSSEAWMKLNGHLEEARTEQPKRQRYFWYAVAASIIGLLIVSVFVLNTMKVVTQSNELIVDDESEVIEKAEDLQKIEIDKSAVQVVATEGFSKEKKKTIAIIVAEEISEKKMVAEKPTDTSEKVRSPLNDSSQEVLNIKIKEVIARVDALEQNQEELTEAEVDSLLRKAQQEILKDRLFRNNRSVDAMALLTEVEDELDKSFRDQIFESLKSGFIKVRTAVADRNN